MGKTADGLMATDVRPPISQESLASPTSVRWKIFFLLLLLVTIDYLDRASLSVALPVVSAEFSLTPTERGLLLSSFFWTYAVMQIPAGLLTDRLKPRLVIGCATMLWGFFQTIAAACSGFVPLLLSRLGLGAAESPIYPAGAKLNGIWMSQTERARGATLLDGGSSLGTALGSLIIAGLISEFGSWRLAFVVTGIGTMVVGVFVYWYIHNDPSEHPGTNEGEVARIRAANAGQEHDIETQAQGTQFVKIGPYLRRPSVWMLFATWMCNNCVFYGLLTWMPTYLYATQGLNLKALGGASFLIFFCGFAGELTGGYLTDRWRTAGGTPNRVFRTMFGLSAFVSMVCLCAVAAISSTVTVVVLLSTTMFFNRWFGMFWAVPGLLAPQAVTGTLVGTMNFCGNLVGIIVPILVGMIVSTTGSYFLALLLFAGAAAGLLIVSTSINYEQKIVT